MHFVTLSLVMNNLVTGDYILQIQPTVTSLPRFPLPFLSENLRVIYNTLCIGQKREHMHHLEWQENLYEIESDVSTIHGNTARTTSDVHKYLQKNPSVKPRFIAGKELTIHSMSFMCFLQYVLFGFTHLYCYY